MEVEVRFKVKIPEFNGALPNDSQIEEWLRYELNDNGQMMLTNPLCDTEIEPIRGSFDWETA